MEDQQPQVQDDGTEGRTRWTEQVFVLWEIIWICFSTYTENVIKKLIILRMWQEKKGATWNSYKIEEGTRVEAVRSFFDGGVSKDCQGQVKNKVGSTYVIQISETWRRTQNKMKWNGRQSLRLQKSS